MNQQQQIDIIQAHMDGKRVLCRRSYTSEGDTIAERVEDWREVARGELRFDFAHWDFKIEPRRVELFMSVPNGVLQAFGREAISTHQCAVSNKPFRDSPQGHTMVQINYLEP